MAMSHNKNRAMKGHRSSEVRAKSRDVRRIPLDSELSSPRDELVQGRTARRRDEALPHLCGLHEELVGPGLPCRYNNMGGIPCIYIHAYILNDLMDTAINI